MPAQTKPRPLSLSDAQMRIVWEGAKLVPPEWRTRYLEAVADRLMSEDEVTDEDVNRAIGTILSRICVHA